MQEPNDNPMVREVLDAAELPDGCELCGQDVQLNQNALCDACAKLYVFGEDTAPTRIEVKQLVKSFLIDELDNGPGRVITHGPDAYDVHVLVTLTKK